MPSSREPRLVADARQLEQLRALDGAGADDHLARCAREATIAADAILDSDGSAVLDADALGARAGAHMQVGPAARGPQIGFAAAETQAAPGVALQIADALVLGAVVVGRRGHAGLHARRVECIAERIAAEQADVDRAVLAARRRRPWRSSRCASDTAARPRSPSPGCRGSRQLSYSAGSPRTHSMPLTEEEPPSTRPRGQNILRSPMRGLRLRVETPQAALRQQNEPGAERHPEPDPRIVLAGLQQQHAEAPALAEAACDRASGRAAADHDVVVRPTRRRLRVHAMLRTCAPRASVIP